MRLSTAAFLLLLALAGLQWVWAWPLLPEPMASHFDGAGRPNGWSSREEFAVVEVGTLLLLALSFGLLPRLLRVTPSRWWNLPHRAYWLAPERRAATVRFVEEQLLWLGAGSLAFVLWVMQLVIDANLHPPPRLGHGIWWALGAVTAALAGWLLWFYRRFSHLPPGADPPLEISGAGS